MDEPQMAPRHTVAESTAQIAAWARAQVERLKGIQRAVEHLAAVMAREQLALEEIAVLRHQRDHARRVAEVLAFPAWDSDGSCCGPEDTDPDDGWHPLPEALKR